MKLILSLQNVTLTKAIEDHILDRLDKLEHLDRWAVDARVTLDHDHTKLPDKQGQPLYIAGKNIELKRRAVGTNGYFCKPEAALAPGLYAVWIKTTFWVFSITDNKATPEKKP